MRYCRIAPRLNVLGVDLKDLLVEACLALEGVGFAALEVLEVLHEGHCLLEHGCLDCVYLVDQRVYLI